MPLPLLVAGIGAAAGIGQTLLNNSAQNRTNTEQQAHVEKMYNLQRQHALEDRDWQAQYNDPKAQMERMQAAGLNPNLVAKAGATEAPAIRSSQAGTWTPQAPKFDAISNIGQAAQIAVSQAQTDNIKANTENTLKEGRLKDIAGLQALLNLDSSKFDYTQKLALGETQSQIVKEQLRKLTMETVTGYNNDNRAWSADKRHQEQLNLTSQETQARLRQAGQQILKTQKEMDAIDAQIKKIAVDNKLTDSQIRRVRQETRNLLSTGDLLHYEKKLTEIEAKNPYVTKLIELLSGTLGSKLKK